MIEEYLSFAGPHIKKLPNLESLELDFVGSTRPDEPKKFDLKSTKIECFKITGCTGLPGKVCKSSREKSEKTYWLRM
jgi:hypothetical protein